MARLRAQNELLSRMLAEEKSKTAKLRDGLISNLTNLVVGFTDAQDASWSSAISQVQAGNKSGIANMDTLATDIDERFVLAGQRTKEIQQEMVAAASATSGQRASGQTVSRWNVHIRRMALIYRLCVMSAVAYETGWRRLAKTPVSRLSEQ
jgi:kinesin family protein 11